MNEQSKFDKFAAAVAVCLLLLTGLGNAVVMLAAALIAVGVGWALYCRRDARSIALSALTGFVTALVIALVMWQLK